MRGRSERPPGGRSGDGTAHCTDPTGSARPEPAQRAVTLPAIPTPPGSRHAYALLARDGDAFIEERDTERGSRRSFQVSWREVALFNDTTSDERHSLAWKLYHLARIRQAGGPHGQTARARYR